MPETDFDVIIIGGGPGGYLAAERAAAGGKRTLLVEKDERLGGVCLNRGCIPTKALLNSAKTFHAAAGGADRGVIAPGIRFDLAGAMTWKGKAVATLTRGVEYQMNRHGVTVLRHTGRLSGRGVVEAGGREYRADAIIVATGSSPAFPVIPGSDRNRIMVSDQVLELKELPRNVAIVGGGVIGVEFASFFSLLGIPVTVIEMLPEILPMCDPAIAALMRSAMKECTFLCGARVTSIDRDSLTVTAGGGPLDIPADLVLLATGRRPNINGVGLEEAGVECDHSGIRVDERMRTNVPGVYAVGDVTGRSMLAHAAYRMGEVAVNTILGRPDRMRYSAIPWVVYGYPELAGVGLGPEQAKKEGRSIRSATLQMRANGRFLAEHGNGRGVCTAVVDANSDALLGVTMMGGCCSEAIAGAAAMIEAEFRVRDIKETVFPHPTVSEILRDVLWELH
jgi:dihydrolipoamide dehydrogenase